MRVKFWLIGLSVVLILIGVFIILTPDSYHIQFSQPVNVRYSALTRVLGQVSYWNRWWPGNKVGQHYEWRQTEWVPQKELYGGMQLIVKSNEDAVKGSLYASFQEDTTQLVFTSYISLGRYWYQRPILYLKARKLQKEIGSALTAIQKKLNIDSVIYGLNIQLQQVKDSSLITLQKNFNTMPRQKEIYDMIDKIQSVIKSKNGEVVGHPMLHVSTEDSVHFSAMTAIPIKSDISVQPPFKLKKMFLGNILMAKVCGGEASIVNAQTELNHYVSDWQKIAPAIPYQSLVTNRLTITDTTKWITELYYPVLY